jgi:hypothetical protein
MPSVGPRVFGFDCQGDGRKQQVAEGEMPGAGRNSFPLKFQKVAGIFHNHFLGAVVSLLVTFDGRFPPN